MSLKRLPGGFRQPPSRRDFLCRSWNGIGSLALAGMLADELQARPDPINPLTPREQHLPRKAKRCIFLFMGGGVSHIDTFDYKPALQKVCRQASSPAARAFRRGGKRAGRASQRDADAVGFQAVW